MKRYDLITNYRCGSAIEEMEPAEDGEWVRFEDVSQGTERTPNASAEILEADVPQATSSAHQSESLSGRAKAERLLQGKAQEPWHVDLVRLVREGLQREADLIAALKELAGGEGDDDQLCWCAYGVGLSDTHSPHCLQARAAILKAEGR